MQKEQKTIRLQCHFTEEERSIIATEMVTKMQELGELDKTLKNMTLKLKAQMAQCKREIEERAIWIKDGYEYREVECEVTFNRPERGKKEILRTDTGETLVWAMTNEEKADLYYNVDENEEDEDEEEEDEKEEDEEEEEDGDNV